MQTLQGQHVRALVEVEAAVVELGAPDEEGLERWVREDVDILAQVPVRVVRALVEEAAGPEAGQVEGAVKQGADAAEERHGDRDLEFLQVRHGGDGPRQAIEMRRRVVRVGDVPVQAQVRQLTRRVLEARGVNGGTAASAARQ